MSARRLPASGHRRQAWKNGLGISRVIAEDPVDAGFDAVRWQVSATEIGADCPFSSLPGLDRRFLVTGGVGVELTVDGASHRVDASNGVFAFRGDATTHCRLLDGPVSVFNIIVRRGEVAANVAFHASGGLVVTAGPGDILVAVDLPALEAWMIEGPGTATLDAPATGGRIAVVRIARAPK